MADNKLFRFKFGDWRSEKMVFTKSEQNGKLLNSDEVWSNTVVVKSRCGLISAFFHKLQSAQLDYGWG